MALWKRSGDQNPSLHGMLAMLLAFLILWSMYMMPGVRHFFVDSVNTALYYPEKPFMELRNIIKYGSNWVLERASLKERAYQLELENQVLSETLQRLGVKAPVPKADFISANVSLRYPEEWWQELRIDKGSKHGVIDGAAVTSDGYLVGRVTRLGKNYSWVQLITSSSFLVAATVDETRDLGVVNGDGQGNLRLMYIPQERGLKRGMKVSTSLMDELIPPGVSIGTIIAPENTTDAFAPMKILAGAHLTQLYSVDIYVGQRRK